MSELADRMIGRRCWGGLDLAVSRDLSAFVLNFPLDDAGRFAVLPWFWAPEESNSDRARQDRQTYMNWARQGFIKLTEGSVTDFNVIRRDICELRSQFAIQEIAYDPRHASYFAQMMQDEDGFELVEFGQTSSNFTEPCRFLERLVVAGDLEHDGNPVLRWNVSNVYLKELTNGNVMTDKKASSEKIDGVVALIMGLARCMHQIGDGPSPYDADGGGEVLF